MGLIMRLKRVRDAQKTVRRMRAQTWVSKRREQSGPGCGYRLLKGASAVDCVSIRQTVSFGGSQVSASAEKKLFLQRLID